MSANDNFGSQKSPSSLGKIQAEVKHITKELLEIKNMQIYRIGSEVDLGDKIKGVITSINIKSNDCVCYQCAWWDGKNKKEDWFYEFEIEGKYEDKKEVGFK